jgi:hypothetical protein
MGILEDLMKKYPWTNMPPYGDCIVINVEDFKPSWESDLKLQNVKPISASYRAHPVYLIPLKGLPHEMHERTSASSPTPSSEPKSSESLKSTSSEGVAEPMKPRLGGRRSDWKPDEDEQLAKLWKKGIGSPKMVKYFSNRTAKAIRQELTTLIRRGVIKPRWHKRKPEKKPEPGLSENAKSPESVPVVFGSETRDVLARLKKLLQETTINVHDSTKPFSFKWYCLKCGLSGEAKTAEVWQVCQFCKGPLIVWDVE